MLDSKIKEPENLDAIKKGETLLYLNGVDLSFDGFNTLPADVIQKYNAKFPDDPQHLNLENWHQFELDNPDTFKGMYQFWCSKNIV